MARNTLTTAMQMFNKKDCEELLERNVLELGDLDRGYLDSVFQITKKPTVAAQATSMKAFYTKFGLNWLIGFKSK